MSDSAVATSASPVAAPSATVEKKVAQKKAAGSAGTKAKKANAAPSHPPTQQMVDASIKNLKERGGSSLLAIKKYITATYKCDAQKLAPFIKKYLKSAVVNGKLIQLSASAKKDKDPKAKSRVLSAEKKVESKKVASKKTGASSKKTAAGAADKKPKAKKAVATKKTAEKKKTAKAKAKDAKKTGIVKSKPAATKAKATATAAKSKAAAAKAPKAKPAASAKPKKTAKKAAVSATAKKPKAKTTAAKK
ncbi:histone H1-like [Drosophila santomea]|uniref:histone H1-like n=1 Tax=Drosophila santomea TaxID=129105 RepID=UPI001952F620|nr:histone H1-like [Drosophila santomea]